MDIRVLGVTEASLDERRPVDLGARKQRALLAVLSLHRGRAVSADTIADLIWDGAPPAGVTGTLQGYVARLRKALEPDRPPRTASEVLLTQGDGYALAVPPHALDAHRFEDAVRAAHAVVGRLPEAGATGQEHARASRPSADEVDAAAARLRDALALWRGTPYAELDGVDAVHAERGRLDELRLVALEDLAVAGLALGQHATVAGELEALTAAHPLREGLWALRSLALARSGRQADALEVLGRIRTLLDEELGLEPSAALRELQTALLRQDAGLAWTPLEPGSGQPPATVPAAPRAQAHAGADRAATAAPVSTAVSASVAAPVLGSSWPMVGRDDQLAALAGLLDAARERATGFAVVTGEPGIGKSRLCAELARLARQRDFVVAVGRCSQDDGAPPLWPWTQVLGAVGRDAPALERPDPSQGETGAQFRTWQAIVSLVAQASAERPLVVVLDDLHWADASTLRVLRLLTETVADARLLVVVTWRDHPAPVGTLAAVAEALGRRHAVRLQLTGLADDAVAEVVEAVAAEAVGAGEVRALRRRTDGNPFFLVEYARLATDGTGLARLLTEPHPPAAVGEVLARRLHGLPPATEELLRTASVIGRRFDLVTLAEAARLDEEEALDTLAPAVAAGLAREDGVDEFVFSHALVRDALYTSIPLSRAARRHARLAEILGDQPLRATEVARHWLAAGPRHAARAWRAASTAAFAARQLYAYEEAADLLRRALDALADDPDAVPEDRYDLLLELVDTLRLNADLGQVRPLVHEAVQLAWRLDDVERVVEASVRLTDGSLWVSASYGVVDEVVTASLRRALDRLGDGDSPLRCRALLALCGEVYHGTGGPAARDALAAEAVAMARRLDDPALLLHSLVNSAISTWWLATARLRFEHTREATALARTLQRERDLVEALLLRASAAGELGLVDEMDAAFEEAWRLAEELHHYYALIVLAGLMVSWAAMRGELERAQSLYGVLHDLTTRSSVPQGTEADAGAQMMLSWWSGQRAGELADGLVALMAVSPLPVSSSAAAFLCRAGRLDEARALLEQHPPDLDVSTWMAPLVWGMTAEAALHLGDAGLASEVYERLAPYPDCTLSAGSGTNFGPVAAFLSMAARATGETDLALAHADRAAELLEAWRLPLAAQWWRDQRERWGIVPAGGQAPVQ